MVSARLRSRIILLPASVHDAHGMIHRLPGGINNYDQRPSSRASLGDDAAEPGRTRPPVGAAD